MESHKNPEIQWSRHLQLLHLPQTPHSGPDAGSGSGGVSVSTAGHLHTAVLVSTLPDTHAITLHLVLATEGAGVLGVLADLHLLDGLPEGSSIPGSVLACDTNLLSAEPGMELPSGRPSRRWRS